MAIDKYQQMLSALSSEASPLDVVEDKTKTTLSIENRSITLPSAFRDIVVEGDANSKTIKFIASRYFDGIDLSDKTIIIKYINAKKQGDWFTVEDIVIDDEFIQFIWLMNEKVTVAEGNISYTIEFSGQRDGLQYYWHTLPSYFKVEKGLDVDDHIALEYPSVLKNHEQRIKFLEDTIALLTTL